VEEVELPIRIGYYNLLNDLEVGEGLIPVFDMQAPYPESVPYIIIDGIVPVAFNTKDTFGYELTVELLIYTTFKGDFGGRKDSDLIAKEILKKVIPSPGKSGVVAAGFSVYMAKLVTSNNETSYIDTKRIYRKRMTFEHLVEQL